MSEDASAPDPRGADGGREAADDGAQTVSISSEKLMEIIENERAERYRMYERLTARADYLIQLRRAAAQLLDPPEPFKPGDIVTWKPGLKNKRFPAKGRPAVVIEIEMGAVAEDRDSGSPRFREPVDLALGIIDGDGDFEVFRYDRRRFTYWEPDGAVEEPDTGLNDVD
jgi:hypothetical protein